jgi:hypothetical protein
MDDGVFHGCELGSEGVGDTLICLKNIGAHPGASPAKEGINQCSYVFLAPVQSQIISIEVDKARVIDAEGKPFVPHKSAERLSRQIMRRFGSEDVTVGSECPAGGLFSNESSARDRTILRVKLLYHRLVTCICILSHIARVIHTNPNIETSCGNQERKI